MSLNSSQLSTVPKASSPRSARLRAPAQVLAALAAGFERLTRDGLLRCPDPRIAAAQFAYLIVGEPLDRAMLVGTVASEEQVLTAAREGVQTFLARYAGKRVVR